MIYLAVPGLSCGYGCGPLTRGRTQSPCVERAESQPSDPQGSPVLRKLFTVPTLPSKALVPVSIRAVIPQYGVCLPV